MAIHLDRQANRETLDTGLLLASIVRSEYDGLSANAKDYVRLITSGGTVIPLIATVRTELGTIFPAGSATRANLVALLKREGSRAEELNLPRVTTSDVADALRS